MLTCEIRVNGAIIGHIYVVNREGVLSEGPYVFRYSWEYYQVDQERYLRSGTVTHDRRDPAHELIEKVLADVRQKQEPYRDEVLVAEVEHLRSVVQNAERLMAEDLPEAAHIVLKEASDADV